jgi:DNA-binding transcriptional MerR regulator
VSLHISSEGGPLRAETRISDRDLAQAAGISSETLFRLVRLGLVEPAEPGASEFSAASAERLARMLRLHDDLEVNLIGAAVIVDLLERLDRLEADLDRLRHPRERER